MIFDARVAWSLGVTFGFLAGIFVGMDMAEDCTEEETPVEVVYQHPAPVQPDGTVVELAERIGGDDATEIALAVLYESARSGLEPNLLLGIIRTENPWLIPDTTNWYGATGLMQVVGWLHLGEFPECGADLTDIYTNVCYGTRIFERKLQRAQGNIPLALLFYNGCWGETYQPGCEVYPDHVTQRGEI